MSVFPAREWAESSRQIALRDGQVQTMRWSAQITVDGKTRWLGSFATWEEARDAERAARSGGMKMKLRAKPATSETDA